jgi:hypothetical protein
MEHWANDIDIAIPIVRAKGDETAQRREETTQGVARRRDESAARGASARWIRSF